MATTSDDGTARLWLIDPLPLAATIRHDDAARSVTFSPDGRWVATAGRDSVARLHELASGREVVLRAPPGPPGGVEGCQAAEEGPSDGLTGAFLLKPPAQERLLVATFGDHSCVARLWDVEGGQPLAALRHAARTTDLAVDPTGQRLVTTSADGNARIRRAIDGSLEHTLPKQPADCPVETSAPAYPRSAAFSPDGARLVTVQTDCAAAVWDVATGALIARLVGHEGRVRTAAFSPDGRLVVTAGADKTPRVWEVGVASAILKRELRGVHTQSVESVAFSPDGRWLATAAAPRQPRRPVGHRRRKAGRLQSYGFPNIRHSGFTSHSIAPPGAARRSWCADAQSEERRCDVAVRQADHHHRGQRFR